MAIQCSKKRWALVLVPLALIIIALIIVGVYFWTRDGDDNDDNATRPEVTIAQGTLRGVNMETYYGRSIFGFKGIPFAQPPVGDLRFAAPVPPDPWEGTFDAGDDSIACAQTAGNTLRGEEDCLYLNVYTPSLPTSENSTLLPVMLFIYGGAFKAGANRAEDYNPTFLLDKDVVLVVPAYRLGVLGFISTGDEVAPGNNGLKDLVRALEWNRDNIQYFGGDPNRVTVFGQSAGGISTHLMAFSSLTTGLFHSYIFESGSAFSYDAQRPLQVVTNRTTVLAEFLGCSTETSTAIITCLRGKNLTQLLMEPASLFAEYKGYPNVVWSPSLEPDIEGAFITDKPANLIAAGNFHDLPFIASVNRDEGFSFGAHYLTDMESFEDFLLTIDDALPSMLTYNTLVANVTAYTEGLKSFFANDLDGDRYELVANLTQLMGDGLNIFPAYRSNRLAQLYAQSPHYLCSFEYRGTFSWTYPTTGSTENLGVVHQDELIYLFEPPYSHLAPEGSVMSEADLEMVEAMVQLWTSFATTGKPTTTVGSANGVIWEEFSTDKNYLRIGNNSDNSLVLLNNFAQNRMDFWEELTASTTWL